MTKCRIDRRTAEIGGKPYVWNTKGECQQCRRENVFVALVRQEDDSVKLNCSPCSKGKSIVG